jgi:hypothetical protein
MYLCRKEQNHVVGSTEEHEGSENGHYLWGLENYMR